MIAQNILNEVARLAIQSDKLLDLIGNESPFDAGHYAAVESQRNTLMDVCRTIESVGHLEPGSDTLALKAARNVD